MSHVLASINAQAMETYREALCQWARANGLEPTNIAAAPGVTVEQVGKRTVIVYWEFQRGDDGRILADPSASTQALMVRRSVTQVETLAQHGYPEPNRP
ncbi:hypothetical protein PV620_30205 [Streptomyces sp. ME02-6978a]|uniref:hypothetical protein n=1 Tax=unclassified Streptomyces TaxID=2593676 RepID=UPI0029AD60FB|nr:MULTISPECIES: hypothetical protein [unclassified Streptomyces]MDX3087179.1 hypothetical protein [Streptomyces sp. ME12-02E]MDX3335821.1 hypothetical protein [Streptomyces sp. ME02-6978a]